MMAFNMNWRILIVHLVKIILFINIVDAQIVYPKHFETSVSGAENSASQSKSRIDAIIFPKALRTGVSHFNGAGGYQAEPFDLGDLLELTVGHSNESGERRKRMNKKKQGLVDDDGVDNDNGNSRGNGRGKGKNKHNQDGDSSESDDDESNENGKRNAKGNGNGKGKGNGRSQADDSDDNNDNDRVRKNGKGQGGTMSNDNDDNDNVIFRDNENGNARKNANGKGKGNGKHNDNRNDNDNGNVRGNGNGKGKGNENDQPNGKGTVQPHGNGNGQGNNKGNGNGKQQNFNPNSNKYKTKNGNNGRKNRLAHRKFTEYMRRIFADDDTVIEDAEDEDYDGRELASPGEYPHMTALGFVANDNQIIYQCGGSLISENFVITAAHCTEVNGIRPTKVRIGDLNLHVEEVNVKPQIRDIKQIINHPDYNRETYYNDISLLELTEDVRFTVYVRPIRLWVDDYVPYSMAYAMGYGATSFAKAYTNRLTDLNMTLIDDDVCNEQMPKLDEVPQGIIASQICAKDYVLNRDTCQGDSGGPLQLNIVGRRQRRRVTYHLVGITSFGLVCRTSYPGVYTRVSSFLDWIEKVVWNE